MTDTKHTIDGALKALLNYSQADQDGVMVLVSRQAIHEVSDEIARLRADNAALLDALKPFAEYGGVLLGQKTRDDGVMVELWDHKITVADMRKAARTALAQAESGQ
jgi:hypothetical protein